MAGISPQNLNVIIASFPFYHWIESSTLVLNLHLQALDGSDISVSVSLTISIHCSRNTVTIAGVCDNDWSYKVWGLQSYGSILGQLLTLRGRAFPADYTSDPSGRERMATSRQHHHH